MRTDILKAYRANRSEHRGLSAAQAFTWAKGEEARKAFFASFALHSAAIRHGMEIPEFADVETYTRGDIAMTIWEAPDPDHDRSYFLPETTREHHGAREFYSGQSDFISLKEARDFRAGISYNMRSAYDEAREYFRARHSKQESETLARAQVRDMIAEYEREREASGYGVAFYFRDAAGQWSIVADPDSSGVWGCEGYESPERAVWDNFPMEALATKAEEYAATQKAARDFAGV